MPCPQSKQKEHPIGRYLTPLINNTWDTLHRVFKMLETVAKDDVSVAQKFITS